MSVLANEESIVRGTLRALLEPRRLVPILIVSIPLVLLQWRTSPREPLAAPLGVAMCVSFVLAAPLSWRVLLPDGVELRNAALRLAIYAAVGVSIVGFLGGALPALLGMRTTLLSLRSSLLVCTALFLAGGWGLGRDIGLEASLLRERARASKLQEEAERAQLLALRSHLDPHFLFNTLNAIAEWCREDGEVAERAVLQLADILRAVLAGVKSPAWPIAEELRLVRELFALHLLRDPNLFQLTWDVPADLPSVRVPPMILLPVAENSVKHGPAAGHRGPITFALEVSGDRVCARVENPGRYHGPRPGSDGLPTVERRLALAYRGAASVAIRGKGERTEVCVDLPRGGPDPEGVA